MNHSPGGVPDQISFLGFSIPNHPGLALLLLTLWFWGIPQAYNLIDGINGLSLGLSALLLGVLGGTLGQNGLLWGGLLAVLAFNFPKARHFLGDCGALMLGTLFAILGVKAFAFRDPNLLLWVFAYPIVDVSLVVGIRRWKDLPLSVADRSHLHHWMMDRLGGRVWLATPVLLAFAALPMLRAVPFPGHVPISTLGALALVVLALRAFKDRVATAPGARVEAQVRREVPFVVSEVMRTHSGPHPKI